MFDSKSLTLFLDCDFVCMKVMISNTSSCAAAAELLYAECGALQGGVGDFRFALFGSCAGGMLLLVCSTFTTWLACYILFRMLQLKDSRQLFILLNEIVKAHDNSPCMIS